ncbi:hypothetical protein HPT29_023335 [Microvirga terrae]|uniref:Uncharacterized protein n=1 Tax=Microvirga terrae TaxID=2740529 RepID=A0ABY5RPZ2_9HYPH|nr:MULTISPECIES: hypothetical protein [Microvirga]UVF19325.1 hypothetical protein HPT29_023335 [Microvirga terrae]
MGKRRRIRINATALLQVMKPDFIDNKTAEAAQHSCLLRRELARFGIKNTQGAEPGAGLGDQGRSSVKPDLRFTVDIRVGRELAIRLRVRHYESHVVQDRVGAECMLPGQLSQVAEAEPGLEPDALRINQGYEDDRDLKKVLGDTTDPL